MKYDYRSKTYDPANVKKRYVKLTADGFRFCEVGADRRYDMAQGTVGEDELPRDVAEAARAQYAAGVIPPYVDWPMG